MFSRLKTNYLCTELFRSGGSYWFIKSRINSDYDSNLPRRIHYSSQLPFVYSIVGGPLSRKQSCLRRASFCAKFPLNSKGGQACYRTKLCSVRVRYRGWGIDLFDDSALFSALFDISPGNRRRYFSFSALTSFMAGRRFGVASAESSHL